MNDQARPQYLKLVLTQRCNLACTYCFEHDKDKSVMSVETGLSAIKAAFQKGAGPLVIDFFGGEPLMAFKTMKAICEKIWSEEQPRPYEFAFITNGTLIHGKIRDWLKENAHRLRAELSLDGTRDMHNANRPELSGRGSFDSIDLDFFKDNWPTSPIKMTVSPATLSRLAEGVIFLRHKGFKVRGGLATGLAWDKDAAAIYREQLTTLVHFYLEHPEYEPDEFFKIQLNRLLFPRKERLRWCGVGKDTMLSIAMDGTTYPCHMFMPSNGETNDAKLAEAKEALANPGRAIIAPECKSCVISPICSNCYGANFSQKTPLGSISDSFCTFSLIEAKVAAYMLYRMIKEGRNVYKPICEISDEIIGDLVSGIRILEDLVTDELLQDRIEGKNKDIGVPLPASYLPS